MNLTSKEILRRLGSGESIASVCAATGISQKEFDCWWQQEAASRVPDMMESRPASVRRSVQIHRNSWGIPSIQADNDEDLFFGFGYAMAQDRLFQLDFLRRKGAGRLSQILGPDGRELDYLWRLAGLQNIFEGSIPKMRSCCCSATHWFHWQLQCGRLDGDVRVQLSRHIW